jgi:PAT family beta-lactamase induction signal transducer AmpG
MSDQSQTKQPGVSTHGQFHNLARLFGLVALASFLLPFVATGNVFSGPDGFRVIGGAASPTGAPSIPLALTLAAIVASVLLTLLLGRARGAAVGVVAYAVSLILAVIYVLAITYGAGLALGGGGWLCLVALTGAIAASRIALPRDWREALPEGMRGYTEKAPLAAFFVGISSGFPYAMIGATLTTRLSQGGVDIKLVTAFSLAILMYNFKFLWSWIVDGVRVPVLHRLGQRVSWLIVAGLLVMAAIANLAFQDPAAGLGATAVAAILVGIAGATYDIVIDAYRIELLEPRQLGVGSGMTQYGWRIGSTLAGALALVLAARIGWTGAYLACALFALPAIITGLVVGEPTRHRPPSERKGMAETWAAVIGPFLEFFRRSGAWLILLFILVHKIGDTLGQLVLRAMLNFQHYTNDQIAIWDVGVGFWAFLIGIFFGGMLYSWLGLKRSVLLSLVLMGVSNASFALLALAGQTNLGLAAAMTFENVASGIGGVALVAYFSALTDLRFTAAQYALISAAASVVGRLLTGTTAGAIVEAIGYANFYWMTTAIALPGILIFWWMMRIGLVDSSIGSAGKDGDGDARTDAPATG